MLKRFISFWNDSTIGEIIKSNASSCSVRWNDAVRIKVIRMFWKWSGTMCHDFIDKCGTAEVATSLNTCRSDSTELDDNSVNWHKPGAYPDSFQPGPVNRQLGFSRAFKFLNLYYWLNRRLLRGNLKHTTTPRIVLLKFLMLLVPGEEKIRLEYCYYK